MRRQQNRTTRFGDWARWCAAAAAIALVAACVKHDPDLVENRNPTQVRAAAYSIPFGPIDTRLDSRRRAGLDDWIRSARLAPDEFVVVVVNDSEDHQLAGIQRRRAESVVRYLARRGVPVGNVLAVEDLSLLVAARILIARTRTEETAFRRACGKKCIERVTARVPAAPVCTDWVRIQAGGDMRGSRESFGCVVDSALRSMVVDKRDLVRGRPLGPADAATMGLGVRDYRLGRLGIRPPAGARTTDAGAGASN